MQDKIKFFALGGLDENGKNMFVVEINDNIFIIEAGIKYPDKHTPGVDIIVPDCSYILENKDRVKAYIISHGHDDQMGALPYVYKNIPAPIYCSRETKIMIERKTKDYGLLLDSKYDFNLVKDADTVSIAGVNFTFIAMTHSTPGALAIAIETSEGYIVYTSDFVVDFGAINLHRMNLSLLAKIAEKGTLLLLSESCAAEKIGNASPKHKITPHINSLFQDSNGRIFISIYSQNAYNMREVIDLAIKTNKKLLFLNQDDYELISELEYKDNPLPRDSVIKFEDINRVAEKDLLVIISGTGEEIFKNLIDLSTGSYDGRSLEFKDTDTFVIASPSVSGTEVISINALDDVYKTGVNVKYLSRKDIASMHAQEEDLKMMLSLLKPKYYLPVKGDFKSLMANAKIALNSSLGFNHNNIFIFDNGTILNIENGKAKPDFKNSIKTGDILVNANSVGQINDIVIQERQKMARDGVIILSISVSMEDKEIVAGPDVQMRGFIFLKDSENIVKQITQIFIEQVEVYLTGYYEGNKEVLIEKIKDRVYRYVRKETGKTPLIFPNILEIDN